MAGHYSAGEGIEGGLREIQEELGLAVAESELIHAGWRREEVFYENGLIEREVQDIFFLIRDLALADVRTIPEEVSGVVVVRADLLPGLATGAPPSALLEGGSVKTDGTIASTTVRFSSTQLVPRRGDYHAKAAQFAIRLTSDLTGHPQPTWW